MKYLVITFVGLLISASWMTTNPLMESVRSYYDIGNGLQCSTKVEIDIPGMTFPEKNIFIEMIPGKKTKVKGSGIIFLPKKGLINQFDELLGEETHVIDMGAKGDYSILKLVAIDSKSDWVTADLHILTGKNRIEKMVIQSRESGEYTIKHEYEKYKYPQKSIITFQTEQFKLPMQLMSRAKKNGEKPEGPVTGIITLTFSDYTSL